MYLTPDDEQLQLKEAARRFCAAEVSPDRLLSLEREAAGLDRPLRSAVAGLGWFGLGLPAGAGGSGGRLADVACVLEECARGLLPRPLIAAMRGALFLADLDPGADVLGEVAAGTRLVALALDEPGTRDPGLYATTIGAGRSGAAASCDGRKAFVVSADAAELHLVAGREEGGLSAALVARTATGVQVEPIRSFGNEPQGHVRYEATPALARLGRPGRCADAFARAWRRQQALALAEMVGGMGAVLDRTVAYVKEREQFGQRIALFQAVRHQVADMGTTVTAARHLAWQAITRIDRGTEQGTELATASAWVGQAFKRVCFAGHHLHGGAGFVVEHPMRFHSERAQTLAIRWTPEAPALAEVASSLLD